jgi:hypothetical protein
MIVRISKKFHYFFSVYLMENIGEKQTFSLEETYLFVTALGDPLVRGLTEVANTRPSDPIAYLATYLYNYANTSRDIQNGTQVSEVLQNHNPPH